MGQVILEPNLQRSYKIEIGNIANLYLLFQIGCGTRTRTWDLMVMSHASCRCSIPRHIHYWFPNWKRNLHILYQQSSLLSIGAGGAVEEKVDPRLEIALPGRLLRYL